jgi:hypothetical protein
LFLGGDLGLKKLARPWATRINYRALGVIGKKFEKFQVEILEKSPGREAQKVRGYN